MTEPENRLARVLTEAVPPLPAPADRVAEVGRRVRRRRLAALAGTAAAAAVALAVGVPTLLLAPRGAEPGPAAPPATAAGPASSSAAGCPGALPPPVTDDRPGALVPAGATQIALCELPAAGGGEGDAAPPRVLTSGVPELLRRLNALPTRQERVAELAAQERAAGRDPAAARLGCHLVAHPTEFVLAVRHPGGVTAVRLDRNCGTAEADGRRRYGAVLADFLTAYRTQQAAATDPATVPAPACPGRLSAAQVATGTARLRHEVARDPGAEGDLLPSALVAVAACRYRGDQSGAAALARRVTWRSGLTADRALLNAATAVRADGGNVTECGTPTAKAVPPRVLDVLLLADATGAVTEVRVWQAPCRAVFSASLAGLAPTTELLARVRSALGPAG